MRLLRLGLLRELALLVGGQQLLEILETVASLGYCSLGNLMYLTQKFCL